MNTKIRYGGIIPLIGGNCIGAEEAFGYPPEAIVTYDAFATNDANYINYMNNTRGLNIPVYYADKGEVHRENKIDLFVSTCP